jgi:hypothetical protein
MGQKFRAAREKKKMNISRAAALTRIKVQHVEMMENDDFSKMPAPTYAKGFIRIYASFLGLDPVPLVQEYLDVHLNPPEENSRAARSRKAESGTEIPSGNQSLEQTEGTFDVIGMLKKAVAAILPQVPRIAGVVVTVFLLVSISRCAMRLASSSGNESPASAALNHQALMKEPPVRYLELPASEEAP